MLSTFLKTKYLFSLITRRSHRFFFYSVRDFLLGFRKTDHFRKWSVWKPSIQNRVFFLKQDKTDHQKTEYFLKIKVKPSNLKPSIFWKLTENRLTSSPTTFFESRSSGDELSISYNYLIKINPQTSNFQKIGKIGWSLTE